jgi:hypothetical protein
MIHDFRTSEVLVPMVLVYLYLDPIYVNVNPITFYLDLDLGVHTLHPHTCNARHCLFSAIIRGESTQGAIQRLYNTTTLRKIHTIDTNLMPAPVNEEGLVLEQHCVSIPLLRTLEFPPLPLFSLPSAFGTGAQRRSEMKGRSVCLLLDWDKLT